MQVGVRVHMQEGPANVFCQGPTGEHFRLRSPIASVTASCRCNEIRGQDANESGALGHALPFPILRKTQSETQVYSVTPQVNVTFFEGFGNFLLAGRAGAMSSFGGIKTAPLAPFLVCGDRSGMDTGLSCLHRWATYTPTAPHPCSSQQQGQGGWGQGVYAHCPGASEEP